MAFDLKQCEADGWKCEVHCGQWKETVFLGELRDGTYAAKGEHMTLVVTPHRIRNIPPKVKRWTIGTTTFSRLADSPIPIKVPLIEDSTGIRVDHSDAVIEVLEELKGCPPSTPHYANIDLMIHKIKKDRGE
jgi:hypothetical protein